MLQRPLRFVALALLTTSLFAPPALLAQSSTAARVSQPPAPADASSGLANGLLAVLEFRTKLTGRERSEIDVGYLAQQVRFHAREALPSLHIITKENIIELIGGKDLADCESECELDTGRRLGADLVITGELARFGSEFKLALTLYETHGQSVIKGVFLSGKTASELDSDLQKRVGELFEPLKPKSGRWRRLDRWWPHRRACPKCRRSPASCSRARWSPAT